MAKKKQPSIKSATPDTFPSDLRYTSPFPPPVALVSPQVITISHFFDKRYCLDLLAKLSSLELTTTPLIKSKDYAARVNDRLLITDEDAAANLWEHLRRVLMGEFTEENIRSEFDSAKGLNPQLRLYRYTKGHYFEQHYDDSVKVGTGSTKWTLLIYLTGGDELVGGDTIFYDDMDVQNGKAREIRVHPERGMALLHRHGNLCLLHEAEMVKEGAKWVLRSDVWF